MKQPTVRALTRQLRELHQRAPLRVAVIWFQESLAEAYAGLQLDDLEGDVCYGREQLPADGAKFDAVAAARRLLAAARDGGAK